jgi:hypothetical protein
MNSSWQQGDVVEVVKNAGAGISRETLSMADEIRVREVFCCSTNRTWSVSFIIHVCICMYVCTFLYIDEYVCVCVYVCVLGNLRLCVCIYIYTYIYVYIYIQYSGLCIYIYIYNSRLDQSHKLKTHMTDENTLIRISTYE